jgi:hypothetical protein
MQLLMMHTEEEIEPAPNIEMEHTIDRIIYPTTKPADVIEPWSTPALETRDEVLAMP